MENQPPFPDMMTWLSITSDLYARALDQQLCAHQLTQSQLAVLSHLARRSSAQRITDIARAVGITQPAATKIIAKFTARSWVAAQPPRDDKRLKTVQITDLGRTHLSQVKQQLFPDLPAHLQSWSAQDMRAFTTYLRRFAKVLDQRRDLDATQ